MTVDRWETPTEISARLLDEWQTEMRASNLSERTIGAWRAIVERAARAAGVTPVDLSTSGIAHHLAGFPNGNTRRTYYTGCAAWSRWLVARGHREDNPASDLRKPRLPRGVPHPISTAAFDRLLASPLRPRVRVMVLLAGYQGLRVNEISRMRGEDVDLDQLVLRVHGKGGVVAELPLHPEIEAAAATMPLTGWWFISCQTPGQPIVGRTVTTHISTAMRRAGVRGVPHSLRHWYATTLLREGTDIRTVQALMRHASLATTQIYLEVTDEARRAAVLRLPMFGGGHP